MVSQPVVHAQFIPKDLGGDAGEFWQLRVGGGLWLTKAKKITKS
jgi:hypothetical protein